MKRLQSENGKTISSFKKEISSLRTGRANISMLDIVSVDVYGQKMPINQLATVSTQSQEHYQYKYGTSQM